MGRKHYLTFLIGLLILFSSFLVACTPPIPSTQLTTPTTSGSPLEIKSIFTEYRVTRIIDGDTIEVQKGIYLYTVRYIGIDTPETVHPSKPVEYFGKEASEKNRELVESKAVRLEKDVSETDKYGRLLRYVWFDDLMVNAELVRLGYAQVVTYPPDVKYQDLFLKLQKEARDAGRGLWAEEEPSEPESSTINLPPPPETSSSSPPSSITTPSPSTTKCAGATAICNDGTCSYSKHRSGTCSHHGGVKQWLNPPPN